jgi:hypothetical protein
MTGLISEHESMSVSPSGAADVPQLLEELKSLRDGESAVLKLIASGPASIGPLREFLLFGPRSNVFLPRLWAVEALARLGARNILLEYLRLEKNTADPEVRLGEEAVEEKAALELAAGKTEDVFRLLLETARRRPLAGIVDALGKFRRPEAIPFLIGVLSDDMCRSAAEDALRKIFDSARPLLVSAAKTPLPCANNESPSSLLRRRTALRLLADGGISREE